MKGWLNKTGAFLCAAVLGTGLLAGCTNSDADPNSIKMWVSGDSYALRAYREMEESFNETVGKEAGIELTLIPKPTDGYEQALDSGLQTESGPDLFMVTDRYFKRFTDRAQPLDEYWASSSIDKEDIYADTVSRYRYNIENNTSTDDAPLYGLPLDNNPTVMFYNKDALEAVGIVVISVPEEELDAFNADTALKQSLGLGNVTVPAKGFYRSINPFTPATGDVSGQGWVAPVPGEVRVFNNRIAMNWDEVEDLGMILTQSYNSRSITEYGYYTEWWFNYGWSVGGNCIADLTGDGDWSFTLGDDTPNYIVAEGQTWLGVYSGTEYAAGEALELNDKLAFTADAGITANADGTYSQGGSVVGVREEVTQAAQEGTLVEMPSTKAAFTRFAYISAVGGLNICPSPTRFSASDPRAYFALGNVALLVERSQYFSQIEGIAQFEWDVAPLPVYKTYTDPSDPQCDTVEKQGIIAAHNEGTALLMNVNSRKKYNAFVVLEFFAGQGGQQVMADNGYVPNSKALQTYYADQMNERIPNISVISEAIDYERPGDWWYMKDRAWIDVWAQPLNQQVRYGRMTLEDFFNTYISLANAELQNY